MTARTDGRPNPGPVARDNGRDGVTTRRRQLAAPPMSVISWRPISCGQTKEE